ncbi:MAG TPA: ABC transporter ATP-binding protein [Blastocatellia bacterium]|nr:ABC transporter ATP-binding protein [Blastocatellia bacterium]
MNSDNTAIRCNALSKRYRIGEQERYKALRDVLTDAAASPFRRVRSAFSRNGSVNDRSSVQNSNVETRNSIWALDDVSFEVKQGEVIGIIGRNGAGKSTLLKILSRITKPTSGHAEIHGRVGSLLEVGTGFHPELTGRENIYLNAAIIGMRKAEVERKFDEIVAFAEVEKFIDTPVKRYSSGMYVRLAFAVAAHMETEVLLVDEVLAVGDAQFQKKCLAKMGSVASEGRTVLFVSHNMNAIEELCQSALLLARGRVVHFGGSVRSMIEQYLFSDSEFESNEWKNKGGEFENRWFKPLRFFVSDKNGDPHQMPVRNDSEMWVQIEADVRQLDSALTVGYAIYSAQGHLLYWSYQTDQSTDVWPDIQKGTCILRSKIPQHFLNEGKYQIELIGGLHFREWLFEPGKNAPTIFMTIHGGLSRSPLWMTKRPGILAPVLEWQSEHETSYSVIEEPPQN